VILLLVADKLELPSSAYVRVYVCYVKSTNNIAIRIIDDDYSVKALNLCGVLLCFAVFCRPMISDFKNGMFYYPAGLAVTRRCL